MFVVAPVITQACGVASATKQHALGLILPSDDSVYGAGEVVYLRATPAMARGSWVTYNQDDGTAVLLAANAIGPVAVALGVMAADDYGWFQISGKAVGLALSGFVDNANCYATATAGSVDDTVVAGDLVKNAKGASAVGTPSAGLAEFEIQRPFMDDGLAA